MNMVFHLFLFLLFFYSFFSIILFILLIRFLSPPVSLLFLLLKSSEICLLLFASISPPFPIFSFSRPLSSHSFHPLSSHPFPPPAPSFALSLPFTPPLFSPPSPFSTPPYSFNFLWPLIFWLMLPKFLYVPFSSALPFVPLWRLPGLLSGVGGGDRAGLRSAEASDQLRCPTGPPDPTGH